jgi:hypothetical protein
MTLDEQIALVMYAKPSSYPRQLASFVEALNELATDGDCRNARWESVTDQILRHVTARPDGTRVVLKRCANCGFIRLWRSGR